MRAAVFVPRAHEIASGYTLYKNAPAAPKKFSAPQGQLKLNLNLLGELRDQPV